MSDAPQQPQPSSRLLYLHISPEYARPPQDAILTALHGCTRFKLHYSADHTVEVPHIDCIEFEDDAKATKAHALFRNTPLRRCPVECAATLSHYRDLAMEPRVKTDGCLLNITELPPAYTASAVYDLFLEHGPVYSCALVSKGVAKLAYYSSHDAAAAERILNFSQVETYQIIVRFPSKYDYKDSFKTPSSHAGKPRVTGASSSRYANAMPSTDRRAVSDNHAWQQTEYTPIKQFRNTRVASPSAPLFTPPQERDIHPIRITDPTRLVVQNIPPDVSAARLFNAFSKYGNISEAVVVVEAATGKRLNIGIVKFAFAKEAASAVQAIAMDDRPEWGDRVTTGPLLVKLYEPKGSLESKMRLGQRYESDSRAATTSPAASENAAPPSHVAAPSGMVGMMDASFGSSVTSSTVGRAQGVNESLDADLSNLRLNISELSHEQKKHRRLLLVVLQDMGIADCAKLADELVQLPAEQRQFCIVSEEYLNQKIKDFHNGAGHTSRNTSPTRLMSPSHLLSLYTPAPLKSPVLEKTAHEITRSGSKESNGKTSPVNSTKELTADQLVRMSAKAIIELASGQGPPNALAQRDERVVRATDVFVDSIRDLKASQQKQRIGEKIFKLFKAKASDARSLSARTIRLLDEEDLRSLMHLCEEYPDILVAKAVAMEV